MIRKVQRFPLAIIFIFYSFGIIAASYIHMSLFFWIMLLLPGFILEIVVKKEWFSSFWLILIFLLGSLNYIVSTTYTKDHIANLGAFSSPHRVRAKVIKSKYQHDNSAQLVLKNVKIHTNKWYSLKGKAQLYIEYCDQSYLHGDQIEFTAFLNQPENPNNPGQFNYRKYLHLNEIYGTCWIENSSEVTILSSPKFSILRWADIVKRKIIALIDKTTNSETAPILKALITGARGEISDRTEQIFIDSGVIHILAVSGLHVGYVTLVFLLIFGFLRFPLKTKYFFTILALWFYAAMVQFKPSVVRAVTMASCILMGKILERPYNIYNALGLAALLQTLIMPLQLFNVGFQLSFAAVFSIVYVYGKFKDLLPDNFQPYKIKFQPLRYLYELFLVSLAAQIGTIPLTIYYFHRIPIISIVANLFAIPLVGLIGALGFAQVILGFIWSGIAIAYGEIQNILVHLLKSIIAFFAGFSFSYIEMPQLDILPILATYITIFLILNADKRRYRAYLLIMVLLAGNIQVWQKIFYKPKMKIVFFDVGQGDAAYAEFPNGKNMLIDCGTRGFGKNYARDVIAPYFKSEGIQHLNILALSHPHNDHIGGAPYILNNFSVDKIWETKVTSHSKVFIETHYLADSIKIPTDYVYAGDYFEFGNQTYIQILHPSQKYIESNSPNFNNASTAFKLTYKNTDILFTGDIEKEAERYLTLYKNYLKSEIIKVPHHGSPTSSILPLIHHTAPQLALISVGENNKFDHPAPETIQKYKETGSRVHRTDRKGALVISSNGRKIDIIDWRE